MINPLLAAAITYAARGWRVLPLYTPTPDGGCTCGQPCGKNLGKHPRIKAWQDEEIGATTDFNRITGWWSRWPEANVGIATGAASGIFVLDPDGEEGADYLSRLEFQYGALPETATSLTGGGGEHLVYLHPGGGLKIGNRQRIRPSLDARGDGGYIVAPPSLHRSGQRYEWDVARHPDDTDPAEAPEWLVNLLITTTEEIGERSDEELPPVSVDPILTGCGWLRHCRDDAKRLGEQAWYGMLTIVGRCEDGNQLAHEYSRPHPEYTREATAAKLKHALKDTGPYSCAVIRKDLGGEPYCAVCPQWERIKTPIAISRSWTARVEPPPERRGETAGFIAEAPAAEAPAAIEPEPIPSAVAVEDPPPVAPSEPPRLSPPAGGNGKHPLLPPVEFISAKDLRTLKMKPPKWAVPDLLPEGISILAGKPKQRKSWLALQTAIAVATGGVALGKIQVEAGPCLYLALEDTYRRLKYRLTTLLEAAEWPADLILHDVRFPRMDAGGLAVVEAWLRENEGARLVIIDTLARFRPAAKANANVYDEESRLIARLKQLAEAHSIAVLVVHHVRKADAEDPFDTVSGSFGLTGAADTTLVLQRKGSEDLASLYVTGRDVEDAELALQWDNYSAWTLLGDAAAFARSQEQEDVIRVFLTFARPLAPREVAQALGISSNAARIRCFRLAERGTLVAGSGTYALSEAVRALRASNPEATS